MCRSKAATGRILLAALCGLAVLPAGSAAQEECSDCEVCPYNQSKI